MQSATPIINQDLVLIGGGHSQAIALKLFAMNPIPGVRLTLISDTTHTPYSGMLPGHIAGFYSFDQTHIDLRRLANLAGAQLYLDSAIGLDIPNHKVICANHPPVAFDYLSIDIGSTPQTISVPGAQQYAIPAKPVPQLLAAWQQLLTQINNNPSQPLNISIVGGGAGGVELALNMQPRLQQILPKELLTIHLFHRGETLLPGHNSWVSNRLHTILVKRGINLHLGENVQQVLADKIICTSGLTVNTDRTFWVTQASAPAWLKNSGLATDNQGFVLVDDTLQSLSHPHIFATGDVATMANHPRPKAGVFAVRQGKPLWENWQRILQGKPLISYIPQKIYLALIGTGDKNAIASWGKLGWESALFWRWKDYIDRKFMQGFSDLPVMNTTDENNSDATTMRCAGCGAKVSSRVLDRVLQQLQPIQSPEVIIGLNHPDDAAIIKVNQSQHLVYTIDYLTSMIRDPYIFGQIAANHCLSDIFAMGGNPKTALAIATIPYGKPSKVEETLYQLLSGVNKVLQQSNTSLIGGHTNEGKELALGLSCQGIVTPEKILLKTAIKPEQVLILSKPLGIGTLFAADMRLLAKGRWIDGAIATMLISNQAAAEIFIKQGATACTDITGFGLLGHLVEILRGNNYRLELDLQAIPILEGATETISQGITSSLQPENLANASYINNLSSVSKSTKYQLLFDPQTSGGLLGIIAAEKANICLEKLKEAGYNQSAIIGSIKPPKPNNPPINIINY